MNTEIFSGINPIEKTTVPDTTSTIQFKLNTSPEGVNAETLPGINPVAKITVPDTIGKFQFTLNTLTPQQPVQSSTAAGVRALQNYEGIQGIYQDVSSLRARNDQQVRELEKVRTQLVKETGAKADGNIAHHSHAKEDPRADGMPSEKPASRKPSF